MEDNKRLVGSSRLESDEVDLTLRPKWMKDYIGQDKVKEKLNIFIKAAKMRSDPMDHILLHGPPGLGKTTLAGIIANEMGVNFRVTSGPAIEKQADLTSILTNLEKGDVLFIDEIHRMNRAVEEVLYPAMEDFALDIIVGKGPAARSLRIDLDQFTLIGATTRTGLLSSPLRDRFGVILKLDMYDAKSLSSIARRTSSILSTDISPEAAQEIAKRSRGTPRIANRLVKRVRDYAQVKGSGSIDLTMAREGLDILEIDDLGLDSMDIKILKIIIENFGGGPVGLDTIAASVGDESVTIEDVYEPYLLQLGFLARTPRGRLATKRAYDHLGYKWRANED